MASLLEISFLDRYLLPRQERKKLRTLLMSQREEYLGSGWMESRKSLSNFLTNSCWPMEEPSIGVWPVEITDLKEFTDL